MIQSSVSFIKHQVAHHFFTKEQEFDTAKMGMWMFIVQEVLFFGGLFVAYTIFRILHPAMFVGASKLLSWKMGALNTIVLITSSFTMVMAVRSAQLSKKNSTLWYLVATFLLAGAFLVVKYFEYSGKIHHGYLPGKFWTGEGQFEYLHIFFGIYFCLTGLHGIHVLGGMGVIGWLIYRTYNDEFYADFFTPVEMVGLYWHLVDLIWIFLFPLLYLIT